MVPRSGADTATHRTASPSEPGGADTAVTRGAGLTLVAVACGVEDTSSRKTGISWVGAPAARNAAPATKTKYGRTRQYYGNRRRILSGAARIRRHRKTPVLRKWLIRVA